MPTASSSYAACCYSTTFIVFSGIGLIFSITLIVAGSQLFGQNNEENTLPIRMVETICVLQDPRVVQCASSRLWFMTWNNGTIIEHPFAGKVSRDQALTSGLGGYPLGAYTCACAFAQSVVPITETQCSAWNACNLNVNLTRYMQRTGAVYKYGGDVLTAIGSLLLSFVVCITAIVFAAKGWCATCCCCCCCFSDETVPYHRAGPAKFTLGDEDDVKIKV